MPNAHFEQLIEQLKPVVNEPDFDKIFRALTEGEDGPTRFQLKMEFDQYYMQVQEVYMA